MAWSIVASTLYQLHCFRAVHDSAAVLRGVSSRLEPLQLPPGFTLCEEGEEAGACWILQEGEPASPSCSPGCSQQSAPLHPCLYFIRLPHTAACRNAAMLLPLPLAGQVCASSEGDLGSCAEEEVVEGPALVGEAALLGAKLGHPCHTHTLRTRTRCKVWRLTAAGFLAALRSRPQVGQVGGKVSWRVSWRGSRQVGGSEGKGTSSINAANTLGGDAAKRALTSAVMC